MRAALGEAVKMAALGDERLFELLEADGAAIARGAPEAFESGAVAEVVERAGWAKVEVVARRRAGARRRRRPDRPEPRALARPRLRGRGGYGDLLHGEAVAYGLRAACRIGLGGRGDAASPAPRGSARCSTGSVSRPSRSPTRSRRSSATSRADKKHAAGRLRWVLPTATGVVIRDDIAPEVVERAAAGLLGAGRPA